MGDKLIEGNVIIKTVPQKIRCKSHWCRKLGYSSDMQNDALMHHFKVLMSLEQAIFGSQQYRWTFVALGDGRRVTQVNNLYSIHFIFTQCQIHVEPTL